MPWPTPGLDPQRTLDVGRYSPLLQSRETNMANTRGFGWRAVAVHQATVGISAFVNIEDACPGTGDTVGGLGLGRDSIPPGVLRPDLR